MALDDQRPKLAERNGLLLNPARAPNHRRWPSKSGRSLSCTAARALARRLIRSVSSLRRAAFPERLKGRAGWQRGAGPVPAGVSRPVTFRGRAAPPAAAHARFARGYSEPSRVGARRGGSTGAGDSAAHARAAACAKKDALEHYFVDGFGEDRAAWPRLGSRRRIVSLNTTTHTCCAERTVRNVIRGLIARLGANGGDENRGCMKG